MRRCARSPVDVSSPGPTGPRRRYRHPAATLCRSVFSRASAKRRPRSLTSRPLSADHARTTPGKRAVAGSRTAMHRHPGRTVSGSDRVVDRFLHHPPRRRSSHRGAQVPRSPSSAASRKKLMSEIRPPINSCGVAERQCSRSFALRCRTRRENGRPPASRYRMAP